MQNCISSTTKIDNNAMVFTYIKQNWSGLPRISLNVSKNYMNYEDISGGSNINSNADNDEEISNRSGTSLIVDDLML